MTASELHRLAVVVVKTVHTAVFLLMLSSICWLVLSGWARRRDRSVAVAASLVAMGATSDTTRSSFRRP